jgi:phosphoglycerate dehydrogenase-like enzyme
VFPESRDRIIRAGKSLKWVQQSSAGVEHLMGKTLLDIGLGGIGSEIARRAAAFGTRVVATDPKVLERPLYVLELHKPSAFHSLLPRADVVASAVPLTNTPLDTQSRVLDYQEFVL